MSQEPVGTPPAAARKTAPEDRPGLLGRGSWPLYGVLIAAALMIAAITLLVPSTPSYDPWCWLVWGREILHGGLHTQGGATWKPLPVFFTTIFAIFGKAQPDLWLLIARAGFIVTVFMSGKLAARLTVWLAPGYGRTPRRGMTRSDRLAAVGPASLAGIIAILAVALSGGWLSNSALGYSEALAVAFLLIGFERHIDGHYRQAFVCGIVAALDRPETWILWGPYGLWLMWKDPGARALVIGLAVLTIVLWFVPQKLGGGSFTSGVTRATHVRKNSNANAAFPFWAEFKAAWTLAIFRVKVAAIVLLAAGALMLGYHLRTRRQGTSKLQLAPVQVRALAYAAASAVFGLGWWVLISLETQAGFSGNSRYLTIGVAFLDIAGAVCFGACAIVLATLPQRWVPAERERLKLTQRVLLGTALLAALFVAFPNWVGSNFISLRALHRSLVYQATLRQDIATIIKSDGGPQGLRRCGAGHIMVEGFQVPMVAWYMDERIADIEAPPNTTKSGISEPVGYPWPNIIMQDRDTRYAALLPEWQTIDGWSHQGAHYRVRDLKQMRAFQDCSAQTGDRPAPTAS